MRISDWSSDVCSSDLDRQERAMTDTERLWAIEAIRALKARYFHGVDTKDAALLRSVFTDDAITDFRSESPDGGDALLQHDTDEIGPNTLAVLDGPIPVPSGSMAES